MNTYIEQSFNMEVMKYKGLREQCTIVWTPVENLNDEGRDIFAHRIAGVEEEWVSLYLDEVNDYLIDKDDWEFVIGGDFDDMLWDDTIDSLLGDDDNYLAFKLGNENECCILDSKFDFLNYNWEGEFYIRGGDFRGDIAMVERIGDDVDEILCIIGVNDSDLDKIIKNDSLIEFIGNKISQCVIF